MSDQLSLLLTDVVDSTALSQRLGDAAMASLWAAHDRVARDLMPRWHGREIDKSDGLLPLFDHALDAAGYALAYHRALAALPVPLKARAGLHVGEVSLRENIASDVARGAKPLEVEGLAKPLAARVMSAAMGGQTLLTSHARAALGSSTLRFQSHGHWRLKGVAEPIELFELGDENSPFTPPPDGAKAYRVVRQRDLWLPVRQVRHSLPAERDAFVGRHDALLELAHRFDAGARLVSVLGMGGSGKTRLATHFGWAWLGNFPGGVWFCDLSQARGMDGITHAVAAALEVPLGKDDPVVQLGNAIAGRGPCLVILDNFEQVSRHAEETLGHWLDRAGDAQFLVTTREVMGLAGEQVYALAPLPPNAAAELFVRRAVAAKSDFQASPDDEAAIAPLVKLLDGLPLAIELAAARVRLLPPNVLLLRMSERFKVLTSAGGRRDRQATLRATFDWSWDLLSPAERAALTQISVFEGGFTLEAAEVVLDLSAFEGAPWPMDTVQSLVEKSFVRQHPGGRFDLLVSMQEYVSERLRAVGLPPGDGEAPWLAAQRRHWGYFASLDEKRAVEDSCADTDNLVTAARRATQNGDTQAAVDALGGAWAALRLRGPFSVGAELAAGVRAMPGLDAVQQAHIESVAGSALQAAGRMSEALPHLEAALANARAAADQPCEAFVLCRLGQLYCTSGRIEAGGQSLEAALALACQLADSVLECDVRNGLGSLNDEMGRLADARLHYEAALRIARSLSDRRREGSVRGNLGNLHASLGEMNRARVEYEAALSVARAVGDRQVEGNMLCNLGLLHQMQDRVDEGRSHLEAALVIARELGHARLECIVLCNLGMAFDALARRGEARRHYDAALAVARRLGDRRSEGQTLGYLGLLQARENDFSGARACLEGGERLLHEVSDRLSVAVLLCCTAEAEQLAGAGEPALAALNRARAIAEEAGAGADSELGRALQRVGALFQAARQDS